MLRRTSVPLATALVIGGAACGGDSSPERDDPFSQFAAAAEQMKAAAESVADRKPVPPVAFRELIDLLPEKVAGMRAQEPRGETTSAGSWRYSQAEVAFRSEDGSKSAEVGIFDYAHIPFLYAPFRMFLTMGVSRESTEGYERSTEIEGHPGFEKWRRQGTGEAVVLVGDRFIVKAETRGLDEGAARKILEDMDLEELASKGTEG